MLREIVALQLNRIVKRVMHNHGIVLNYTSDVLQLVISRCTEIESGGRMIDAILTNTILPQISRELLSRTAEGNKIQTIDISVQDGDFIYRYLE